MSDPRKVEAAEKDLADFDREEETRKLEEEIDKQINALNDKISKLEDEKQAWQDLVDEQQRQLERAELELELNQTIEEAIFQEKEQTMENYKNAYVSAINEMIAAMEALMAAEQAMNEFEASIEESTLPEGETGLSSSELPSTGQSSDKYETVGFTKPLSSSNSSSSKGATSTKKSSSKTKSKKASGSTRITSSGLYNIDENGDEALIPPAGRIVNLPVGTGIIPANMTSNLMEIGKYSLAQLARLFGNSYSSNTVPNQVDQSKNIVIENLSVKSNNASDFIRQLQNLAIVTK